MGWFDVCGCFGFVVGVVLLAAGMYVSRNNR
jgi:hypothetical protein